MGANSFLLDTLSEGNKPVFKELPFLKVHPFLKRVDLAKSEFVQMLVLPSMIDYNQSSVTLAACDWWSKRIFYSREIEKFYF